MNKIITFPHLADYGKPISCFFESICKCKVYLPPNINDNTKKKGSKYSPDYVCSPFKFNLGNYIEALDNGANILIQAGGGCRYGYYAELQKKILEDLGYKFIFINLIEKNKISVKKLYKFAKSLNKSLNIFSFSYYFINCALKIILMDKLESYIRLNKYNYLDYNKVEKIQKKFKYSMKKKSSIISIVLNYIQHKKEIKELRTKTKKKYKIAIIGELYTLMEKEASCRIEKKLMQQNFIVFRKTSLTYLLVTKKITLLFMMKIYNRYIKNHLGADGTTSVIMAERCAKKGYDGIIHMKSFGCTPEINAMPMLNRISNDYNIPIIYYSFDILDNEINVDNRLEAFCEMIKMRKSK